MDLKQFHDILYIYDEMELLKLTYVMDYKTLMHEPVTSYEKYLKQHQFVEICKQIHTIKDLIDLATEYPYDSHITYNIDMKMIHNIKDDLIQLDNMIGLQRIKKNIIYQIIYFVQNMHSKNEYLHTCLYGAPGTGKTEIAKCIGNIFAKLGILKKGTFTKVTRADMVAGYLGQTAIKTKKLIEENLGGVLFIDEAYSFGNKNDKDDAFAKECIDTLCETLSHYRDQLMVIIAGYEDDLEACFFKLNKGLKSRFSWKFWIDEYTSEELRDIFLKKVKEDKWKMKVPGETLDSFFKEHMETFPYFGRDVEVYLSKVKISHSKRVFTLKNAVKKIIIEEDIENGYDLYKEHKKIEKDKDPYFIYSMYS